MAYSVEINSVDYTPYCLEASLSVVDAVEIRGDQLSISIRIADNVIATPKAGAIIYWYDGATKEFGGQIVSVNPTRLQAPTQGMPDIWIYDCQAVDFTLLLDRVLVKERYPAQDATTLFKSILSSYTDGFTTTHVTSGSGVVPEQTFDYVSVSSALDQIARAVGWRWYVDFDKDVHFFAIETHDAPITEINIETETRIYSVSGPAESIDQERNRAYVKDFRMMNTDPYTEEFAADGFTKFFPLAVEPSLDIGDVQVTVNGTPLSLLEDFVNSTPGDGITAEGTAYFCLTAGHKVLTVEGYKNIEQLIVGDEVLTHRGIYRKVTSTFEVAHQGKIRRINVLGMAKPIIATLDHPLFVVRREKTLQVKRVHNNHTYPIHFSASDIEKIPVQDIQVGDFLVNPIPDRIVDLPQITYDHLLIAGYYLAEGVYAKKGNGIQFGFHQKEVAYVTTLRDAVKRVFNVEVKEYPNSTNQGISIYLHSEEAKIFLEQFGRTSWHKKIPEWLYSLPKDKIATFLKAYWEGDGCHQGHYLSFATVSRNLALGLRRLLLQLGIICRDFFIVRERQLPNGEMIPGAIFYVQVHGEYANKLSTHLQTVNPNNRGKRYNCAIAEGYAFYEIKNTEEDEYNGPVYDITVEEDHSFVFEGILGGNCQSNWGIRFPDGSPPASGDIIEATYSSYSPENILRFDNVPAQIEMASREGGDGVHEFMLSVPDIRASNTDSVEAIARIELDIYGPVSKELSFSTVVKGWLVNQVFTAVSARHNLNQAMYVVSVRKKVITSNNPVGSTETEFAITARRLPDVYR